MWFNQIIACLSLLKLVLSVPAEDEVTSIPTYSGTLDFKVYSGYLDGITGKLFYFFTESSNVPANDPLVLWLNGGPGCSSLLGAFLELGPFHPTNGDNVNDPNNIYFEYNPYSWNHFANMLFIESPPCVGYSFPTQVSNCNQFYPNDNSTKYDNYYALQSFFKKFPEYLTHKFYLSGESYAGHYLPQLGQMIVDQNELIASGDSTNSKINLISIAAGNPFVDEHSNYYQGWLPQAYSYGILSTDEYESCMENSLDFCENQTNFMSINVYDVNVLYNCTSRSHQETALLRYIYKSNDYEDNLEDANIWQYPYDPCNEHNEIILLNKMEVWEAFHVNVTWMKNASAWNYCNDQLNIQYNSRGDHSNSQVSTYDYLLQNNISILVYSGNDDLVCAYEGSRYWIDNNLSISDRGNELTSWQPWFVNGDVGGWYQAWEKFVFLVVRDAGHEVPEYQPARAYVMFKNFLNNNWLNFNATIDVPDENFANYGTSESSSSFADSHFWAGFGIAIGVMIGINIIIFVIWWFKYKRSSNEAYTEL